MAQKTIHSSSVTFVDYTDSRKLDVYISSNLPQTQIYNPNSMTNAYTPDWTSTNLVLTADVYLDSKDVTNAKDINGNLINIIEWYEQLGTGTPTLIGSGETLTITTNKLSTNATITYTCEAKYNDNGVNSPTAVSKITFTRVDTGINGTDGTPAPQVLAQYSVDGSTGWTAALNTETHKYIRHSYDGGMTWSVGIKMKGEDGKSVAIKGTAASVAPVSGTDNYYTITYGAGTVQTAQIGDGYIYNGDLYVCVASRDGEDYFTNVGRVQGPKGDNGTSRYTYIMYSANSNGSNMVSAPSSSTIYIGICITDSATAPITASSYTWSKFVGDSAKSIILNGDSQVFKVGNDDAVSPATIRVTAQTVNTSITTWTYSTNGGQTFTSTAPTGVARNGNVVTVTGASLATNSIVIKATDGVYSDIYTVYKAFDGSDGAPGDAASMAFLTNENVTFSANANGQITATSISTNVVAYNGTTKVTPTIGTITGLPTGMTATVGNAVNNEVPIVFTITNNATLGSAANNNGSITIPVNSPVYTNLIFSWSKVNSGAMGTSASLVDITPSALYFKSTTGKDGVFTPEYIYLYPRFQSVTYNNWQYSTNGGTTWTSVSGVNGLTVGTYNSTANSLRIARTSTLYTDTITSVSFRCNSSESGIYDVVSITKIYDVVDLQIGGRNLITSNVLGLGATNTREFAVSGWAQNFISNTDTLSMLSEGETYTISFDMELIEKTKVPDLYVLQAGLYLYSETTINDVVLFNNALQSVGDKSRISVTFVCPPLTDQKFLIYTNRYTTSGTSPIGTDTVRFTNLKLERGHVATDWTPAPEDLIEEASNINVMLSNEAHFFEANSAGVPTATSIVLDVIGYKGSIQSPTTVGTITGLPSAGMAATISNNNTTNTKITVAVTTALTSSIADYGVLTIPITVNGKVVNKVFSWSKSKEGKQGNQGNAGTPASLVKINPSALYFKSTTGKDGTFTPQYIYLYPTFQNATYSNWQYSINGGTSWVAASGANGLAIGTYSSVANSLRIDRASALFTDTVTSITFRCNTTTSTVYDTVSIAKIYDVVDLVVGDKNLLLNSGIENSSSAYRVTDYTPSEWLISGEEYTLLLCVTPAPNVTMYTPHLSQGYAAQGSLYVNGTNKQVLSLTFKATYNSSRLPEQDIRNGNLVIYRFPNDGTVTDSSTIHWAKLVRGNKATTDWTPAPEDVRNVTLEVYAPNGYLLTNELPSLSLQTFAFDGSIEIASGATYQWSHLIDNAWVAIDGATGKTLTVTRSDVLKSKSYKCEMVYKSKTYSSTVTVQDKTDTYNSIMAISSNAIGNDCYWVLYTLVYSDTEEVDPLLGPISTIAPTSPTNGAYWYAVDAANASVQLKKYNGSAWVNSTDTQSLSYYWDLINDGSAKVPIGTSSKVQVISCHDFTATATVVCEVSNIEDGVLTQSSLTLTDVSDPIVSDAEPTNVADGQIWIKPNSNGTYLMFVWDAAGSSWISNDMDKRNKVYTSKPTSYNKGDIWITESDTAHSAYLEGTLLQASNDNTTYTESDWASTLKYDKAISEMEKTLNDLSEYVSITTLGLRIGARSSSGELSPFTSLFTSTELSFYQNSEKLLTLANNQLTAPKIVVEDDLEVQGTISLGNLKLVIESNGSFSFAVSK